MLKNHLWRKTQVIAIVALKHLLQRFPKENCETRSVWEHESSAISTIEALMRYAELYGSFPCNTRKFYVDILPAL